VIHHVPPGPTGTFIPGEGSAVGVEQAAAQEGLPRTPLIEQGPAVAPYNPPAVNNPSERVMQSDQSFQLDRGIGNNPTNRDEYVREQLNK
jgi:hypothetical protein